MIVTAASTSAVNYIWSKKVFCNAEISTEHKTSILLSKDIKSISETNLVLWQGGLFFN